MEQKEQSTFAKIMQILHRDIGYFLVGIISVYALSGTLLIFRMSDFMKHDVEMERSLTPGLSMEELAREMRLPNLNNATVEGDMVYFQNGSYNSSTGEAVTIRRDLIFPFNKFSSFHRSGGTGIIKYITGLCGLMLFFLAVSSFWMYKKGSKKFWRGIILASTGIIFFLIIISI